MQRSKTMEQARALIRTYLEELAQQLDQARSTPELSLRNALHNLLSGMAALHPTELNITGEPKREVYGQPDFIVNTGLLPVGHVEAESINADLRHLTGEAKEQNDRFIRDLDNFLQTNHLEFRLFQFGKEVTSLRLPDPRTGPPRVTRHVVGEFQEALTLFFDVQAAPATSTGQIAELLAKRAHLLRLAAENLLARPGNIIRSYLEAFRQTLYEDLDEMRFADVYAQTFTYGLFLSWLEHPLAVEDPLKAIENIPKALPPVRVLLKMGGGDDLPPELRWIVDAICRDLSRCDPADALTAFRGKKDPLVHFYEHFLAKYDPKLRESRGVYYTPDEVVSFIVRSVDEIAKDTFGKQEGIADRSVLLLDPAVGTGTFLVHCYRLVKERLTERRESGYWPARVQEHILKHFYGFEIMPSAYTLAHLKCRFTLSESGVNLNEDERLPIYLTNSLEHGREPDITLPMMAELSKETREASRIKNDEPILIVLGNPPYSGESMNPSRDAKGKLTSIGLLLQDYFFVDGEPLGEKNPKWLNDDYVKFIRFAQDRIVKKTQHGVVGFITNHSYLDNPTFRGMRRSLMKSFHELYFLDLHGNTKKKEVSPDGSPDKNVFDIQQGVAICLLIRKDSPVPEKGGAVYHAELYGTRSTKEKILGSNTHKSIMWTQLMPSKRSYLFVPQDESRRAEYEKGWKLTDIFPIHNTGMVSKRDRLAFQFEKRAVLKVVRDIYELSTAEIVAKYPLRSWSSRDGKPEFVKNSVMEYGVDESRLVQALYRPFDLRWTYYTPKSKGFIAWPVYDLMRHMLYGRNLGLITTRQTRDPWGCVITRHACAHKTCGAYDINSLFPLYLYPTPEEDAMEIGVQLNLSPEFLKDLAEALDVAQTEPHGLPEGTSPEDVIYYAYAVFYSPTYRTRYAELLRGDFPRIPLPSSGSAFRGAADVGAKLVALHLLEDAALETPGVDFPHSGSDHVEKYRERYIHPAQSSLGRAKHSPSRSALDLPGSEPGRVKLNDLQSFVNVPVTVWEYRVGGYQPAKKWLDDRVGRILSEDEITHYRRMIAAIRETLALLPACDEAFLAAAG